MNPPTFRNRMILWVWCILTSLATLTLLIYLPMSTSLALEELSERPTPITIVFGLCAAVSVGIVIATRKSLVFQGALRLPMIVATISGVLGFGGYTTYVYAFSQSLAVADSAPAVGELAPQFAVTDPEGRLWSLEGLDGYEVLLVFYRGHW